MLDRKLFTSVWIQIELGDLINHVLLWLRISFSSLHLFTLAVRLCLSHRNKFRLLQCSLGPSKSHHWLHYQGPPTLIFYTIFSIKVLLPLRETYFLIFIIKVKINFLKFSSVQAGSRGARENNNCEHAWQ